MTDAPLNGPRRIDQPRPGFFRMRLVAGGWAVPCRIEYLEAEAVWRTTIDTEVKTAADPVAADVFKVWLAGREIAEWVYLDLVDHRERARAEAPGHPCLTPRKPIDPMRLRPRPVTPSILGRPKP